MRSWVWNHYLEIDQESAMCTICKKVYARSGGTKGLIQHLKRIHLIQREGETPETRNDPSTIESNETPEAGVPTTVENPDAESKLPVPNEVKKVKQFVKCSFVWDHFQVIDKNSARCGICERVIARSGGTKGMSMHLIHIHGINRSGATTTGFSADDAVESERVRNHPPSRSWVWGHYDKIDKESAKCKHCSKKLARNGGTKGLVSHLRRIHTITNNGNSDALDLESRKVSSRKSRQRTSYEDDSTDESDDDDDDDDYGMIKFNPTPSMSMSMGRSFVWDHMTKIDRNSAECNHCNKILARSGGTKGLRGHLLRIHNITDPSSNEAFEFAKIEEGSSDDDRLERNYKQQQACHICKKFLSLSRHPLSTTTRFTGQSIHDIMKLFTGETLQIEIVNEAEICEECFDSLEKYDELQHKSRQIQSKMTNLYYEMRSVQVYIKEEPEEDIDDFLLPDQETSGSDSDNKFPALKPQIKPNNTSASQVHCDQCPMKFTTCKLLRQHMKTHLQLKPEVKLPRCESCSKNFRTDTDLQIHQATDHDRGTGPFDCPICFKSYNDRTALRTHFHIHSSERSFLCGICGATFLHKKSFNMHMMAHEDNRPYVCTVPGCSKKFISSTKLKIHLRVHTGEKVYECPHCCPGKRFAQKWGMDLHIRKQHNNQVVKNETCKICGIQIRTKGKLRLHLENVHQVAPNDDFVEPMNESD